MQKGRAGFENQHALFAARDFWILLVGLAKNETTRRHERRECALISFSSLRSVKLRAWSRRTGREPAMVFRRYLIQICSVETTEPLLKSCHLVQGKPLAEHGSQAVVI